MDKTNGKKQDIDLTKVLIDRAAKTYSEGDVAETLDAIIIVEARLRHLVSNYPAEEESNGKTQKRI